MKKKALLFLFLSSCTTAPSWQIDSIEASAEEFTSTRLRFLSNQAHSPLLFEIVSFPDQVSTFLQLSQFQFRKNPLLIQMTIEGKTFEEKVDVYRGKMRVRLSEGWTQKIIEALQEGHQVSILVDGFEEVLTPDHLVSTFFKNPPKDFEPIR